MNKAACVRVDRALIIELAADRWDINMDESIDTPCHVSSFSVLRNVPVFSFQSHRRRGFTSVRALAIGNAMPCARR